MSLITVTNLTFGYDGSYDTIFEHATFQIDTNWKIGLIGRNGRGKTTFLNLLLGKYEYSGTIVANTTFEYFPYSVADVQMDTITVVESICPNLAHWEIVRELSFLDVSDSVLYRPFATLSNGEQTKVLLAALFLKENCFLLIDEPTNHLDTKARTAVSRYLKRKRGYLLVSHDRALLDASTDHILCINKTNIEVQKGNFSSWQQNKQKQDHFDRSQDEKLNKEIKRLSSAAKRTAAWSDSMEQTKFGLKNSGLRPDRGYVGHKSAKMMQRAKTIEARQQTAIEQKKDLLKNIDTTEPLKLWPLSYHTDRLVSLENIRIFYGENQVCQNISFILHQEDRIALLGKNGCGKSSILKLICGEDIPHSGIVGKSDRLKISYIPQNTDALHGTLTQYALQYGIEENLFKAILRKLDFSRVQFEKDMEHLSSGQKKKVLIARSLCEKAHLYIWDEPLNFIDILSRIQIEELMLTYRPTILFVEHDETFCKNIATKFISID